MTPTQITIALILTTSFAILASITIVVMVVLMHREAVRHERVMVGLRNKGKTTQL